MTFLEKRRRNGEKNDFFTFSAWRPKLKVELERAHPCSTFPTKTLTRPRFTSYQRISQTYQTYSGRDRSRGLTQAVNYLEEQLSTLKIQAKKSMRSAQAFALSNGLGLQDGMPAAISAGSGGGGSGSVETSRETTQNKVNALKQQLTASRQQEQIRVYVAPQLEANTELYTKLQKAGGPASREKGLLRDNDPSIQTLQRRIRALTKVINQQTIGLLEGQLQTAQAQLTSLTRPGEVVLKHRELVRTASGMRQQSPSLRPNSSSTPRKSTTNRSLGTDFNTNPARSTCRSSKKENHRFWPTRRRSNRRQRCRSVGGSANGTGFQH